MFGCFAPSCIAEVDASAYEKVQVVVESLTILVLAVAILRILSEMIRGQNVR